MDWLFTNHDLFQERKIEYIFSPKKQSTEFFPWESRLKWVEVPDTGGVGSPLGCANAASSILTRGSPQSQRNGPPDHQTAHNPWRTGQYLVVDFSFWINSPAVKAYTVHCIFPVPCTSHKHWLKESMQVLRYITSAKTNWWQKWNLSSEMPEYWIGYLELWRGLLNKLLIFFKQGLILILQKWAKMSEYFCVWKAKTACFFHLKIIVESNMNIHSNRKKINRKPGR